MTLPAFHAALDQLRRQTVRLALLLGIPLFRGVCDSQCSPVFTRSCCKTAAYPQLGTKKAIRLRLSIGDAINGVSGEAGAHGAISG